MTQPSMSCKDCISYVENNDGQVSRLYLSMQHLCNHDGLTPLWDCITGTWTIPNEPTYRTPKLHNKNGFCADFRPKETPA